MDYKILVHSYMCVFMTSFVCGSQSVNYSTAIDKCKEHNGLASYQHFMNSSRRRWDVNKFLRKGQSAWISGNVTFPDSFVRWLGCFENTKPELRYYSLPSNGINECLQQCSKTAFDFIGIADSLCYCILYDNFYTNLLTLKNDSECKQKLFLLSVSHGKEEASDILQKAKIDVYEVITIDHGRLTWTPSSNKNIGQCVYYMYDGIEEGYVTGSCNSKETGFMCTNTAGGQFNANCSDNYSFYSNYRKFCYDSRPSTWKSSFKHCRRYSSNLPGLIHSDLRKNIKQKSKGNVAFWTGLFRSFTLNEFQDKELLIENSICLSVLNINNTLVFDPVECSSDKEYICEMTVKSSTYSTHTGQTNSNGPQSKANSTVMVNKRIGESDSRVYVYALVGIIVLTLVSSVICLVAFRKKIWYRLQMDRNTLTRESVAMENQVVSYENVLNVQTFSHGNNAYSVPTGGMTVNDRQVYETLGDRRNHENDTYESLKRDYKEANPNDM